MTTIYVLERRYSDAENESRDYYRPATPADLTAALAAMPEEARREVMQVVASREVELAISHLAQRLVAATARAETAERLARGGER